VFNRNPAAVLVSERPRLARRVASASVRILLGWLLAAGSAQAAPCGHASRPWVSVAFVEGTWPAPFEQSVLGDLAAGLRRRDMDACREGAGPPQAPVAVVRLARRGGTTVVVAVEVRDAATEKRVSRELDLLRVPADGRSFALALATDELLWASWAELGLTRNQPNAETSAPSRVLTRTDDDSPAPPPGTLVARLGVRAAAERFLDGQTQLGGDAMLLLPLASRVQLDLAGGYRRGLDVEAPHGSVVSHAAAVGANLRYLLIRERPVELGFVLGARAAWVRFEGRASGSDRSDRLDGVVAYARAGLASALELGGGTWLELGALSGLPLRGLQASDTGRVVAGVSGVEFASYLAFLVEL
jgi:hypothetical protein